MFLSRVFTDKCCPNLKEKGEPKSHCDLGVFDGPRDILCCSCQEGKLRNFIFCKNSRLQNRLDFGNTSPGESHYGFAFTSTNLSPMTNSESKRYHYPICPDEAGPPIILYPDSKVQREALYCPPRGPSRPPRSCSGFSRRKSKMFLFSV